MEGGSDVTRNDLVTPLVHESFSHGVNVAHASLVDNIFPRPIIDICGLVRP